MIHKQSWGRNSGITEVGGFFGGVTWPFEWPTSKSDRVTRVKALNLERIPLKGGRGRVTLGVRRFHWGPILAGLSQVLVLEDESQQIYLINDLNMWEMRKCSSMEILSTMEIHGAPGFFSTWYDLMILTVSTWWTKLRIFQEWKLLCHWFEPMRPNES